MFLFTGLWFQLAPKNKLASEVKRSSSQEPSRATTKKEMLLHHCRGMCLRNFSTIAGRVGLRQEVFEISRGGAGRVEPGRICRFSSLTGIRKIGRAILTRPDSGEVTRLLNKTRFFFLRSLFLVYDWRRIIVPGALFGGLLSALAWPICFHVANPARAPINSICLVSLIAIARSSSGSTSSS